MRRRTTPRPAIYTSAKKRRAKTPRRNMRLIDSRVNCGASSRAPPAAAADSNPSSSSAFGTCVFASSSCNTVDPPSSAAVPSAAAASDAIPGSADAGAPRVSPEAAFSAIFSRSDDRSTRLVAKAATVAPAARAVACPPAQKPSPRDSPTAVPPPWRTPCSFVLVRWIPGIAREATTASRRRTATVPRLPCARFSRKFPARCLVSPSASRTAVAAAVPPTAAAEITADATASARIPDLSFSPRRNLSARSFASIAATVARGARASLDEASASSTRAPPRGRTSAR